MSSMTQSEEDWGFRSEICCIILLTSNSYFVSSGKQVIIQSQLDQLVQQSILNSLTWCLGSRHFGTLGAQQIAKPSLVSQCHSGPTRQPVLLDWLLWQLEGHQHGQATADNTKHTWKTFFKMPSEEEFFETSWQSFWWICFQKFFKPQRQVKDHRTPLKITPLSLPGQILEGF